MIGRPSIGSEADAAYWAAFEGLRPGSKIVKELGTNAGVQTDSEADGFAYGLAYASAINASDVSVRWDHSHFPAAFTRKGRYIAHDLLFKRTGHLTPSEGRFVIDHEARPRRITLPTSLPTSLLHPPYLPPFPTVALSPPSVHGRSSSRGCFGSTPTARGSPRSQIRRSSSSLSSASRLVCMPTASTRAPAVPVTAPTRAPAVPVH